MCTKSHSVSSFLPSLSLIPLSSYVVLYQIMAQMEATLIDMIAVVLQHGVLGEHTHTHTHTHTGLGLIYMLGRRQSDNIAVLLVIGINQLQKMALTNSCI